MSVERRAIIDKITGKVLNAVVIDTANVWQSPDGTQLLSMENSKLASIGDTWDGEKIIKKEEVPQVDTITPIVNFGAHVVDAVNKNKATWNTLSDAEKIAIIGKILTLIS